MTTTINLTARFMSGLKPGKSKRYYDEKVKGLQVWVGKSTITYYVRKRAYGKEHTIKIGSHPHLLLEEARLRAIKEISMLVNHSEACPERDEPTFGELFDMYYETRNYKNTLRTCRSAINRCSNTFMNTRVSFVTANAILDIHKKLCASPYMANKVVNIIHAIIGYFSKRLGIQNPIRDMEFKPYPEPPRKRCLTESEMPAFLAALEAERGNNYRTDKNVDILKMLLYTGARKSNVIKMKYCDIEGNLWTIPANEFKGKRIHRIWLGEHEMEIINRRRPLSVNGHVFEDKLGNNGHRIDTTLQKVLNKCGIQNLRIHDLRRTLGSWMLSSGSTIEMVSKKLGHTNPAITARVYADMLPGVQVEMTDRAINAMLGQNVGGSLAKNSDMPNK